MLLYHITEVNLGETALLIPQIPYCVSYGGLNEPDIKRICVSPTIEGCLWAVGYSKVYLGFYVYATESDDYVEAWDVYDAQITKEKWLLKETIFNLVYDFDELNVRKFIKPFFTHGINYIENNKVREVFNYMNNLIAYVSI